MTRYAKLKEYKQRIGQREKARRKASLQMKGKTAMANEKHYVTFVSPGTFFSETSQKPIASWDVPTAVKLAKAVTERYGAKPHSFYFTTVLAAPPIDDGRGGVLEVKEKQIARSAGNYFLGGTLLTYEELEARNLKDEEILRSNMRCNGWPVVIENTNSWKATLMFEEDDCVVDEKGKITVTGADQAAYRKKQLAAWKKAS